MVIHLPNDESHRGGRCGGICRVGDLKPASPPTSNARMEVACHDDLRQRLLKSWLSSTMPTSGYPKNRIFFSPSNTTWNESIITPIQVIFTNKERLRESGSPLDVGVRKESFDPRPFHHPLPDDGAKEDGCLQSLSIVKSSHNPNQSMINPCKNPQNIVFCVKISRNAHPLHRQKPVLL